MNFKKLLCLVMAMLLTVGALALAEEPADLQAELDAANARIAELEGLVELYRPFYDKQVVAEYGDGGIVWLEDAQAEFDSAASAYAQYGLSIDSYADTVKQQILENLVREAVIDDKAAEFGLGEIDEETRAGLEAEAAENFETYIESYKSYFAQEGASDEEAREQTVAAMAQYGLTQEALMQQMVDSYMDEQLHAYVTQDVAVDDDEIQAKYEAMVAADEEAFTDSDYSYNSARNDADTTVAWNPEGYRAVKHVLIKFDDEQSKQYNELKSTLDSLNAELEAANAPAEEEEAAEEEAPAEEEAAEEEAPAEEEAAEEEAPAEEEASEEEAAEEEAEAVEPEGDAEDEEAPRRSVEEIQADIGRIATEIEALYSQLLPDAQKVVDEFNGGADFDSLIEQYNADPGMQNEPTATNGYAVAANSTTWDPAFTEGAMSIEAPGQISAPIYGSSGIHVIYYLNDITPGAVPFEQIADAVKAAALDEKINKTYDDAVAAWVEAASPVYHPDRF